VAAFDGRITYALTTHVDHKTELQEELARQGRQVAYNVLDVQGPPHDRTFTCAAMIDGEEAGVGTGRSKKDAEQAAAGKALARLRQAA
jgi:ribonuclease-3